MRCCFPSFIRALRSRCRWPCCVALFGAGVFGVGGNAKDDTDNETPNFFEIRVPIGSHSSHIPFLDFIVSCLSLCVKSLCTAICVSWGYVLRQCMPWESAPHVADPATMANHDACRHTWLKVLSALSRSVKLWSIEMMKTLRQCIMCCLKSESLDISKKENQISDGPNCRCIVLDRFGGGKREGKRTASFSETYISNKQHLFENVWNRCRRRWSGPGQSLIDLSVAQSGLGITSNKSNVLSFIKF